MIVTLSFQERKELCVVHGYDDWTAHSRGVVDVVHDLPDHLVVRPDVPRFVDEEGRLGLESLFEFFRSRERVETVENFDADLALGLYVLPGSLRSIWCATENSMPTEL